jgi:hypothetical protein
MRHPRIYDVYYYLNDSLSFLKRSCLPASQMSYRDMLAELFN